jgi:hypothetical protein
MPDAVMHVLLAGTPGQVRESVVERIPIQVASVHARWARAAEGLQDEDMHFAKDGGRQGDIWGGEGVETDAQVAI